MPNLQNRLMDDFNDADVARVYMDSHVNYKLAAQIYQTRQVRGWTQAELAERSGIAQARVSKIEAGEFDSLTMATLRKFAKAFDVTVRVELQPFSYGIVDVCNMTAATLTLPDREASIAELRQAMVLSGWFTPEPTLIQGAGQTMLTRTQGVTLLAPGEIGATPSQAGFVTT